MLRAIKERTILAILGLLALKTSDRVAFSTTITMSSNGDAAKPPTILEKIYAQRQKDVEQSKETPGTAEDELKTYLEMQLAPPLIPLVPRLKTNPSTSTANPSLSLMAEIKVNHYSFTRGQFTEI